MTFDELRRKLGGGRLIERDATWVSEIPSLPVHVLDSLDGLRIWDTGFPGCFSFWVPAAEGKVQYVGIVSIGPSQRKHGKGTLTLHRWLAGEPGNTDGTEA
jgi:hypothetical protein